MGLAYGYEEKENLDFPFAGERKEGEIKAFIVILHAGDKGMYVYVCVPFLLDA